MNYRAVESPRERAPPFGFRRVGFCSKPLTRRSCTHNASDISLHRSCDGFFADVLFLTVGRLKPLQKRLSSFARVTTTTANSEIVLFAERSSIIEVFDRRFKPISLTRPMFHRNIAIYTSLVSRSNLSFDVAGNAVCVGHMNF